jgi:2,5-diamino-6-(ribosylamino)-4(3H)-pyrimidinone 5'-phosphate reductase
MPTRPYVICHMVASIDGKILSRRWKHLSLAKEVSSLYESTASEYEVSSWMVGTKTLREFFPKAQILAAPDADVPDGGFVAKCEAESFAIGCDANGSTMFDDNQIGGDHLVVIITEKVGKAYRSHLRKLGISYLICGKDEINLVEALEKLFSMFGTKKILLEGGGLINGAMLQAGLIDEISQLIVPVVDGGGAEISGLYDLRGEPTNTAAFALSLIEQKTLAHGTQWLRYKVIRAD